MHRAPEEKSENWGIQGVFFHGAGEKWGAPLLKGKKKEEIYSSTLQPGRQSPNRLSAEEGKPKLGVSSAAKVVNVREREQKRVSQDPAETLPGKPPIDRALDLWSRESANEGRHPKKGSHKNGHKRGFKEDQENGKDQPRKPVRGMEKSSTRLRE